MKKYLLQKKLDDNFEKLKRRNLIILIVSAGLIILFAFAVQPALDSRNKNTQTTQTTQTTQENGSTVT